ncbi:hypothetical protein ACJRO7_008042 [Eucalyptus globulus]|uniref:Uncharacterized protein n=1 Tax=Eucalyptus globulus TaxID=34317 RepID=A0ABD3IQ14_EUCGL
MYEWEIIGFFIKCVLQKPAHSPMLGQIQLIRERTIIFIENKTYILQIFATDEFSLKKGIQRLQMISLDTPKLSGTVKGKLRLGAKIRVFGMEEGEEFLKASQCYLSTSAGPIRSITFPSPDGKLVRSPYKVLIPTEKIKRANRSENMNNPFWLMGFSRYEKAFENLEKAMTLANRM